MARIEDDPRLRIGLTGGIASGKSLAAECFRRRGAAVVDADVAAREVTAPGSPGLHHLVRACGAALLPDGALDRRALRERMFADPMLRTSVEAALHQPILDAMAALAVRSPGPYLVLVVPLLVERRLAGLFHRIAVVDVAEATQVARLQRRDHETAEGAHRILAVQAARAARLAQADDVLANEGDEAALDAAVGLLHERYLALAGSPPFPRAGRGGENAGP